MPQDKKKTRPRGRQVTRERLLEALGRLLARDGFQSVGVNAVSREADVDKVLIYRYFGGMSGLLAAYGDKGDLWPDLEELTAGDPAGFARLPARDKACLLARNLLAGLRSRPATQEVLAWELVEHNELTSSVALARERTAREALDLFRPAVGEAPLDADLEAAQAVVLAAVSCLTAHARRNPAYAGLPLEDEPGWERLRRALDGMLLGLLSFGE
jgi:AcrR family transcriptional regulator